MEKDTQRFWESQMKFGRQPVHLGTQLCVCRNLDGYYFSTQASAAHRKEISEKIQQAICALTDFSAEAECIEWGTLGIPEKRLFQLLYGLKAPWDETVIWVNPKRNIQMILHDGDHLRIQKRALQAYPEKDLQELLQIESALESHLTYAFDPQCGYFTCDPKMLGTGIQITYKLHIPALCFMQQLARMKASALEMDLELEPVQVSHEKILGHQISLATATELGTSEKELLAHVAYVGQKIIKEEIRVRQDLWENNTLFLKDSISRALGVLKHCYELTYDEAVNMISIVLMAMDAHFIPVYKRSQLLKLWHSMQREVLPLLCKEPMPLNEEVVLRAQCVHQFFAKYADPFEMKNEEVLHVL